MCLFSGRARRTSTTTTTTIPRPRRCWSSSDRMRSVCTFESSDAACLLLDGTPDWLLFSLSFSFFIRPLVVFGLFDVVLVAPLTSRCTRALPFTVRSACTCFEQHPSLSSTSQAPSSLLTNAFCLSSLALFLLAPSPVKLLQLLSFSFPSLLLPSGCRFVS